MIYEKFYYYARLVWFFLLVLVGLLAVFGQDIIDYQETGYEIHKDTEAKTR